MQTRKSFQLVLSSLVLLSTFIYAAEPAPQADTAKADTYTVEGARTLKNGVAAQWRGVNAFHVFSLTEADMRKMDEWKIDIVREVVVNMKHNPLTGGPQKVGNSWLYSLQEIVKAQRAHGRITILCPFAWGEGPDDAFLGKNPSQTRWWNDYLAQYRDWAKQFKDQPDVWFGLWNEPYAWDGKNGYSEALWLSDMTAMVDNIRAVAPDNIIVVPAAKMCGDETVLVHQGAALLKERHNIVFDVHAYNGWLPHAQPKIEARIKAMQDAGCALMFGETGNTNAGYWLDPTNFLRAVDRPGLTTLAWIWKEDKNDGNSLLGPGGVPSESSKYKWGKTFYDFLQAPH